MLARVGPLRQDKGRQARCIAWEKPEAQKLRSSEAEELKQSEEELRS